MPSVIKGMENKNIKKAIIIAIIVAVVVVGGVIALLTILPGNKNNEDSGLSSAVSSGITEEESSEEEETVASTPVNYYGEMIVKDGIITGSKTDEKMRVTGMSFFWSNWSQKYYNKDYVDLMVDDFNCEIVRCSYGIQDDGVPYDETCVPLIEDVVNQAIERGVYVILDWHSHGAHKNPEESIEFFADMAKKYGQYDNVIFEIFNEPMNTSWLQVKKYAEQVIPEIRKHSDNLILVGTPNWSQDVLSAAKLPVEGDNIAYTLHFYAGTHKKWLRDNADKAMKQGIALFVSEWGSVNADGNGGINKESTEEWMQWIDENQLSSCNWAINDKNEGSSIYVSDSEISETGKYIRELIKARTLVAPWREAKSE